MTKNLGTLCLLAIIAGFSTTGYAEEGGHHLPHNHIALIAGGTKVYVIALSLGYGF